MTRMTETKHGEIRFYKPMLGTDLRDSYDRLQAGEVVSLEDVKRVSQYNMEMECVQPYIPGKQASLFKLKGEWHDFIYYPASQVYRITAREWTRELDAYKPGDSEFAE